MAEVDQSKICEIFVVKYGQPEKEKRCVESVLRHTDQVKYKLSLIDNLKRDVNLGALWNQCISSSESEYVCLLNSDTKVESGWLDKLIETMEAEDANAIGPVTNKCGIAFQVRPKAIRPTIQWVRTLSGFCLVLRKEAFVRAGGFRQDFPLYGQESNLLDRMDRKIVRADVFVHHDAGGSFLAHPERLWERQIGPEVYHRNLGFDWSKRLLIFGAHSYNPFPLWKGIAQGIREFERQGMAVHYEPIPPKLDKYLVKRVRAFLPDVTIVVSTRVAQFRALGPLLKILPGPKGLWWNDLRAPDTAREIAGWFDGLFMCWAESWGKFDLGKWKSRAKAQVYYMPQGSVINPELDRETLVRESVFIGGTGATEFHTGRSELVKHLGCELYNCTGRSGRIEIEKQTPKLYRSSKYVLATSPKAPGYNSLRLYNILAYGGLALVDYFPGAERLFENGQHVLFFRTPDHARGLMNQYSNASVERERISRAGWRLQQAKHTAGFRLMNIVANLTTADKSFWGYLQ
jgi:hypothetical protein